MQTRVDKWLWAVRIFKTRSDAAEACRTGKVTINGTEAKPSKEVKEGDILTVKKVPVMRFTYKVLGIVERRLPAKDVPTYCLDITPEDSLAATQVVHLSAQSSQRDHFCYAREGCRSPHQERASRLRRPLGTVLAWILGCVYDKREASPQFTFRK